MRPRDASWAPILVGLLAGVGTRVLAQPISVPLVRGAATALVAVLAMVGTRQFITYSVQQQARAIAEKNPAILATGENDADDQAEDAMTEEEDLPKPTRIPGRRCRRRTRKRKQVAEDPAHRAASRGSRSPSVMVPKPGLGEQPLMVGLSYAVGIMLAYFLGKGPALAAETSATDAPSPSE